LYFIFVVSNWPLASGAEVLTELKLD